MVFLVREDLKLGAGKIAAQVAHAAVGLFDEISQNGLPYYEQALEYWHEFGAKKNSSASEGYRRIKASS